MARQESFRFMTVESTDSARVVTTNGAYRRGYPAWYEAFHVYGEPSHLRTLARHFGCTIIVRPKRSNG